MINELLNRYPQLSGCGQDVKAAAASMIACYRNGGKILLCGNGGSSADCDHIVGELMKGFLRRRPLSEAQKHSMMKNQPDLGEDILNKLQGGLPAVSLPSITALCSAVCNDLDPELMYAQSVLSLGGEKDILIAISTSGNAKNVLAAARVAKGVGMKVIGLTGKTGGQLKKVSDVCITVPETETYQVQELHLPIYHCLCAVVEKEFFAE